MSKIIFELVLQDVNAQQAIAKFRQEVKQANAEIQKGVGGDRFKELTEKVTDAKVSIFKLTEEQKKLRKEFAATQVPTDSLAGLRIAYAQVTEQVTKLTKAERESNFGKKLIKDGAGLKSQIDGIEQSLGRFTGNVGNYKSALLGVGDLITGGLATGGAVAAVGALAKVMQVGIDQAIKYEKALDDLSALTGLKGEALDNLEALGKELQNIQVDGVEIVNTGPDILEAMKLVGGARPELLESAAALADVTKQAIVLSAASGDTLDSSVTALTTVLGQFNEEASASGRIINELAAGAKVGSSEIPQTTDALKEFGTVAKISNISTGQSIALIETLAARQLKGAEAGTQLRNVLTKLASADVLPKSAQAQFEKLGIDINVLKDSTLPLETRLRELGKAQGDLSALTKIFGLENLQAATIITSNLDQYDQLKKGIEGTTEAYDQAAVRSDNLSTKLENLKNGALNSLQEEFNGATTSGGSLLGVLGSLIDGFEIFGKKINVVSVISDLAVGPLGQLLERINAFTDFFKEDEKPKGLQGLDVDALRSSVDLLTGEVKPAVEDVTGALLSQANALIDQGKAADESTESDDKKTKSQKKLKEETVLVNGSLAFFRDQIADLKKTLDNTPADSPLFAKLQQNIIDAETALDSLQEKLKTSLDPADLETTNLPATPGGITVPVSLEVTNEDETAQKLADFQNRVNENAAEIKKENDEKQAEEDDKRREEREEQIKEASFAAAQAISDGIFNIQKNKIDQEKDAQLEALDIETEKKIEAAAGNTDQIAAIEKDADKKRAAIEKAAAQRRKNIALIEIVINTALAIAQAAPNIPLMILAGVIGAAQLAVAASQKFARGGVAKQGTFGGKPHSAGGTRGRFDDGTEIEVEADEDFIILNKKASAERRRLSNLNSKFGGVKFDTGGIVNRLVPQFGNGGFASDFTPQIGLPSSGAGQTIVVQTTAEISDAQMDMLAAKVATQTGRATKAGVGEGLEDNNRLQERQAALVTNREA